MLKQHHFERPARILRIGEVVGRTGVSRTAVYELMAAGEFPRQVRLGARSVGWDEAAVDAWIRARIAASVGAAG